MANNAIIGNVQLVKDEEGNWYYPSTQRKDGTWRKSVKVKCGHLEEHQNQVKYVIRPRRKEPENTEVKIRGDKPGSGAESQVQKVNQVAPEEKMSSLPKLTDFMKHLLPPIPGLFDEKEKEKDKVPPSESAKKDVLSESSGPPKKVAPLLEEPRETSKRVERTEMGTNVKTSADKPLAMLGESSNRSKDDMGSKKQPHPVDEVDRCASSGFVEEKPSFDWLKDDTATVDEIQKVISELEKLKPSERAEAWNRLVAKRLYERYQGNA